MTDISERQRELAQALVFGSAENSTEELLAELGMKLDEYSECLASPEFMAYLFELASRTAQAESARVIRLLSEHSKKGDIKTIKLYLDLLRESVSGDADENDDELASVWRDIMEDGT